MKTYKKVVRILFFMDVIEDVYSNKEEIIKCINKYGSVREHNFWFYFNQQTDYAKVHFFKFGEFGIKSIRYNSGKWEIIGDLLSPKQKRMELFESFVDYALLERNCFTAGREFYEHQCCTDNNLPTVASKNRQNEKRRNQFHNVRAK